MEATCDPSGVTCRRPRGSFATFDGFHYSQMNMANETNTRTVSATVLGLLILLIGSFLLLILASSLVTHTDFVFSISRRTFNIFLFGLVALFLTAVFLFGRSLRRHHLN